MKPTSQPMPGDVVQLINSDATGIVLIAMQHVPATVVELNNGKRISKQILPNTEFKIISLPITQMPKQERQTGTD